MNKIDFSKCLQPTYMPFLRNFYSHLLLLFYQIVVFFFSELKSSSYTSEIDFYDLSCICSQFDICLFTSCYSFFLSQSYLLNFTYSNLLNFTLGHLDFGHTRSFFYLPDYKGNHPRFI